MRFKTSDDAAAIMRRAIDYGFNYVDTAPEYRFSSAEENSETWIGRAISSGDYRQRIFLSSKSSPIAYGTA